MREAPEPTPKDPAHPMAGEQHGVRRGSASPSGVATGSVATGPIGETVRLIEGGPLMTVEAAVGPLLLCVWFDETGRVRRQAWSPHQLVRYRPRELTWLHALGRLARSAKLVALIP